MASPPLLSGHGCPLHPVLDGWDDVWEMLRDHLVDRINATVEDVIVGLDFSLLD
ncbi:hypothetical protein [Kitasatospora herbaricolor]|uniref:hypothetical protein n=1 Tax=Kitasatospora herbaricolor TaxID=68217 RepID=UPI0036DF5F77